MVKRRMKDSLNKQVLKRIKRGKTDAGMIKKTQNQRLRKVKENRKNRYATREAETQVFPPSAEHSYIWDSLVITFL